MKAFWLFCRENSTYFLDCTRKGKARCTTDRNESFCSGFFSIFSCAALPSLPRVPTVLSLSSKETLKTSQSIETHHQQRGLSRLGRAASLERHGGQVREVEGRFPLGTSNYMNMLLEQMQGNHQTKANLLFLKLKSMHKAPSHTETQKQTCLPSFFPGRGHVCTN